jgi:hypothetical protein
MDNELRDDLISAALDGEQVDVEVLRELLRNDDGRETLAAFVLLRAATAADQVLPTRRFAEFDERAPGPRRVWSFAPSRLRLACAASIALLALVGAFWFGTTLRGPAITLRVVAAPTAPGVMVATPPTADVRASAAPGDHSAPVNVRAPDLSPVWEVAEPPKPTRRLSFVPGVDWTSTP